MNRYIRLDDALKAYDEAMDELVKWQMDEWQLGDFSECEFNTTDCKHIARKIINAPSIDIVRCDECKYEPICNHSVQHTTHDFVSTIYAHSITIGYKSVDYCSYGERRE